MKSLLLPHDYRMITAKKWYVALVFSLEVIFFIVLCFTLGYLLYEYRQIKTVRQQELKTLSKWENLIQKFPNYPEVYYNAALYEARVGDKEKAILNLRASLRLNPNFTPSLQLQKVLDR